ncbi:Beta-lactamase-like protein 2, partial [Chytridiales sp. JEL 0842]
MLKIPLPRPPLSPNHLPSHPPLSRPIRIIPSKSNSSPPPKPTIPNPRLHPLTPRVVRLTSPPSGPFSRQPSNAYLIGTGPDRLLFDTGTGNAEFVSDLKEAVANFAGRVGRVVVGHGHGGHSGGLWRMLAEGEMGGVEVMKWKVEGDDDGTAPGGETWSTVKAKELLETTLVSRNREARVSAQDFDTTVKPLSNSRLSFLKHNQTIYIPGPQPTTLRVLHTPGHSPDHVSLYLHEESSLFSGDAISASSFSSEMYAHLPFHIPMNDLRGYKATLEMLQRGGSDWIPRVVYPGHGDVIPDAQKAIESALEGVRNLNVRIVEELKRAKGRPVSVDELSGRVLEGCVE